MLDSDEGVAVRAMVIGVLDAFMQKAHRPKGPVKRQQMQQVMQVQFPLTC